MARYFLQEPSFVLQWQIMGNMRMHVREARDLPLCICMTAARHHDCVVCHIRTLLCRFGEFTELQYWSTSFLLLYKLHPASILISQPRRHGLQHCIEI